MKDKQSASKNRNLGQVSTLMTENSNLFFFILLQPRKDVILFIDWYQIPIVIPTALFSFLQQGNSFNGRRMVRLINLVWGWKLNFRV